MAMLMGCQQYSSDDSPDMARGKEEAGKPSFDLTDDPIALSSDDKRDAGDLLKVLPMAESVTRIGDEVFVNTRADSSLDHSNISRYLNASDKTP